MSFQKGSRATASIVATRGADERRNRMENMCVDNDRAVFTSSIRTRRERAWLSEGEIRVQSKERTCVSRHWLAQVLVRPYFRCTEVAGKHLWGKCTI